jgi:putative membrane protein insertion efficiency factor
MSRRPGLIARLLTVLVRGYQLVVSPWFVPRCRFYPSCSTYAVTALRRHGALKGSWLAARRLLRCHPWNPGGVDHVPPRGSARIVPETSTSTSCDSHSAAA